MSRICGPGTDRAARSTRNTPTEEDALPDIPDIRPPDGARRRGSRRFLPLLALAVGLALFFALDLDRHLSFRALADHRDALQAFAHGNAAAAAAGYIAVYALAVALSVPGATVLTLAGGFLFGTWLAAAYVVVGATAGAAAVFLAARSAFGGALRRRAGPWAGRLEAGFRRDAFSYLLALRLMPLFPFWLVNLVAALLDVPFGTYVLGTMLGIAPGSIVYASVGNGLGTVIEGGGTPDPAILLDPEVLLPLAGLALLSLAPILYRRLKGGRPKGERHG